MPDDWLSLPGVVVAGHRVASGASSDYPYGTLVKQMPFFQEAGLDLAGFFPGTLNISILPLRWRMLAPDFTFRQVAWTDLHPPEDFSFSACQVCWAGQWHAGWIYYPHPETKRRHFQDDGTIEVISVHLPGVHYGAALNLAVKRGAILLKRAPTGG